MSILAASQRRNGSSTRLKFPAAIRSSSLSTRETGSKFVIPASVKACAPFSRVRLEIATSLMPGVEVKSWSEIMRPVTPAPTRPTRIGLPAFSRSAKSLSIFIYFRKSLERGFHGSFPDECALVLVYLDPREGFHLLNFILAIRYGKGALAE